MPIGLFIDHRYLYNVVGRQKTDYFKLRNFVEKELNDIVDEGYFFNADDDKDAAAKLHSALSFPPPNGPGLRVKTYWLQKRPLFWPDKTPVMHPTKQNFQYELTTRKAVDVGLVYHMTRSFMNRKWDKLVLIAGDGDFYEPVQGLVEQYNVDLYIMGSIISVSDELKPYARKIYEMDKEPLLTSLAYTKN
ncbi:MAG: NYN domain-containing protein [Defluviitaleaceae bacterium]|nr:NYN domain-containing protein [Defluviitaleaceae bacterium]